MLAALAEVIETQSPEAPPAVPAKAMKLLPIEAPESFSAMPLAEPPPTFDWISISLWVTWTSSMPAAALPVVPSLPFWVKCNRRSRDCPTLLTLQPAAVVDCVASHCWQIR